MDLILCVVLQDSWKPNEAYEQKVEANIFKDWYPLAKSQKIVEAAMLIEGVQHVLTPQGEWVLFSEMSALYPLDQLRVV